jgi:hypothetical protein
MREARLLPDRAGTVPWDDSPAAGLLLGGLAQPLADPLDEVLVAA